MLAGLALLALAVALFLAGPSGTARAQDGEAVEAGPGTAILLDVDGAIGPATTDYLTRGLEAAAEQDATLVVLRIDTPGGLDTAMRDMIREILASPVPVLAYVAPPGARAASAGTYILYASHVAAMAPGTNLGAATPVRMGGGAQPLGGDAPEDGEGEGESEEGEEDGAETGEGAVPDDAMAAKTINDAVAYIRGLAELRGRNADWAERAVRRAESLPAREALEREVVDIVAGDVDDLLAQAHGREVALSGQPVTLDTRDLRVVERPPDWRARILAAITNPNLAYILLLIGIYGIVFELASPGTLVPGVVGAISLLVGLFALNLLPINLAGLGLIGLGVALMAAEAFLPAFGALGLGGAAAFLIGSLFLFDDAAPGFELALSTVLISTAVTVALFLAIIVLVVRAHRRRVVSGGREMLDADGEVLTWSGGHGQVLVHGERWQARCSAALEPGRRVRVRARDGLVLDVEPETG